MKTLQILMLVTTDVAHDGRVLREAEALAADGHRVHIVGKDVPGGWAPPAGTTVSSVTGGAGLGTGGAAAGTALRRTGRWLLLPEHRARVTHTWRKGAAEIARGTRFDVVHAHDFDTLALAAELASERGARLVYDAHEWWSGRQRHGRPTPLRSRRESGQERRLLRRADAVLTVSRSVADRLTGVSGRPVHVVRNTFPRTTGDTLAPPRPRGIVYAGRIGRGRDLEAVITGAARTRLGLVLMGEAEPGYLRLLRGRPGSASADVRPAEPLGEVDTVLAAQGICAVPLADSCENHRCALPNKLFQAVRVGVPVVAADLPELRAVVGRHGLGELYRPGDAASFAAAVAHVVDRYPALRTSVARAGRELCWERDAETLTEVYDALCGRSRKAAVR